MESFKIHFEKMNNFDLHPLSQHCPAQSSGAVDQYTHHHGKGDSAYSSFSGGSTAPDCSPSFLVDDSHLQNLNSTSPLYQSMETTVQQHYHGGSYGRDPLDPFTRLPPPPPPPPSPLSLPLPPPPSPPPPTPPPPDYLDSFIKPASPEPSVLRRTPEGQLSGVSSKSNPDLLNDLCGPTNHERRQDLVKKIQDSESVFTRTPLQTRQHERLDQKMEKQLNHRRSRSACWGSVTEQQHTRTCWYMPQNTSMGSIQHKGQFYYVTGMYKPSESSVPPPCPTDHVDIHTPAEVKRSHNTVADMFKSVPLRTQSSGEIFVQDIKLTTVDIDKEPSGNHCFSKPPDVTALEHMNSEEARYHIKNHPIFYSGPENSSSSSHHKPGASALVDQSIHLKIEQLADKPTPRHLADVPTEKISKEATPLLYHLTGASRTNVMKSRNRHRNSPMGHKEPDSSQYSQALGQEAGASSGPSENMSEAAKAEKSSDFYYLCNTMDDSFKKYYKEKLKDAQTKVLRETSFKRKDLRLSWQKMIEHCCDKRINVVPPADDNPNPAPLLTGQRTDTLRITHHEMKKEMEKQQSVAQPQVPRVGCRKRLTLEQKKLSNSEPEKLHHLDESLKHSACRSLGSEIEGLLSEEHLGQHGLVSVRSKIVEVRGRAMSACSFSKNSLKNFQQKALAAYMERKSGCNVAKPQQASPQVPTAEGQSDQGPKPYSGSMEKLLRPQSTSRIHESGFRHAKFTVVSHGGQTSIWRDRPSAPSEKSASVEDLLEERQIPRSHRSFSTSSPHSFYQINKPLDSANNYAKDYANNYANNYAKDYANHDPDSSRAGVRVVGESPSCKEYAVPDEKRVRMVAFRGKSMEELGASVVFRPEVLSRSSDQLNQIHMFDTETKSSTKFGSDHVQLRRRHFQDSGSLEHTASSTAGTDSVRTSVSGSEFKVTAVCGSATGTDENNQLISTQVHEVSFSHGVTTEPNLWLSSEETHSASQCEQLAVATPLPPLPALPPPPLPALPPPPLPAQDGGQDQKKAVGRKCPVAQAQWVKLVQDVVTADQSLASILYPVANRKTAVMLMEQMLSEDTLLMEDYYKKKQEQMFSSPQHKTSRPSADDDDDDDDDVSSSTPHDCTIPHPTGDDVTGKKRQLMAHIEEQLESLEALRLSLRCEQKEVDLLEHSLELVVRDSCLPAELERYTHFIQDLERVISLLLCLSARLARVQNALSTTDDNTDPDEKESLCSRYQLLCKQREDAKDLKDNLDRRERMVSMFLVKYLPEVQLQEYRRFIQNKASLLIRLKDLEEKQRLGEEQLQALLNSIPPSSSPPP